MLFRMPSRRFRVLGVLALALLSCSGRSHVQREGIYSLRLGDILRDECAIAPRLAQLWTGSLIISGDVARLQMDTRLFSTLTTDDTGAVELIGYFLAHVEQFSLDGSAANVVALANNSECLLNLVQVHLDGTSDSPQVFTGTTRIRYITRSGSCECELWARYTAVLQ